MLRKPNDCRKGKIVWDLAFLLELFCVGMPFSPMQRGLHNSVTLWATTCMIVRNVLSLWAEQPWLSSWFAVYWLPPLPLL